MRCDHVRKLHASAEGSTRQSENGRQRNRARVYAADRNIYFASAEYSRGEIAAYHLHATTWNWQRNHQTDAEAARFQFPGGARAGRFRWSVPDGEIAEPGKCRGVNDGDQSRSKGKRRPCCGHRSDCDRMGAAVRARDGKMELFSGNQIG